MENYVETIKENLEKTSKHMWSWWIWSKMGDLIGACRDSGLYSESELRTISKNLFWAGWWWGWPRGKKLLNETKEIIESKFPTTSNDKTVLPSDDSIKNN